MAALISVSVSVVGQASSASAALPVTWDGSTLGVTLFENATSSVIGCNAVGGFTLNGVAPSPAVLCGEIASIVVFNLHSDGLGVYQKTGTIDLRGVTKPPFGRLTATEVQGFDFGGTIHDSPFTDQLSAGSNAKLYGYAGKDRMWPSVQTNEAKVTNIELWGGDGADSLSGDGAINARLEGGAGLGRSVGCSSIRFGQRRRRWRCHQAANGRQAQVFGGPGDDVIVVTFESASLVDAGSGVDQLKVISLRSADGLTAIRVPDPQPKTAITEAGKQIDAEQFEKIEISRATKLTITMDPSTAYVARAVGQLTVKVPGGVWNVEGLQVTAAGLAPVSWNVVPAQLTIIAA